MFADGVQEFAVATLFYGAAAYHRRDVGCAETIVDIHDGDVGEQEFSIPSRAANPWKEAP